MNWVAGAARRRGLRGTSGAARRVSLGGTAGAALLAVHAAYNLRLLRRPERYDGPAADPPRQGPVAPEVSVLVPARDEAARIAGCVRSLLSQRGVDLEVVVLDDGSTDGTPEVVRTVAGGDPRVRVLTGAPPPAGWLGKPHACAQLAAAARGSTLVFVDADVVVAADGLARGLALARRCGPALVCPYPRQQADGVGPRLVQPLLQWSILTFLPLRLAERLPTPALSAANGQFMLTTAGDYAAAGGHAGVRDHVLEDVALARAYKRSGLRAVLADGTDLATCRMYGSWAEARAGYTKSLWAAFGSPAGAAAVVAGLAVLYLLPPLLGLAGVMRQRRVDAAVGLAGYAAGVAGRAVVARRTGGRLGDTLAHPASIAALGWLTGLSWWCRTTGRLRWKGRPLGSSRHG